ncbi:hypothetical protein SRHO_G00033920 [Serrasalmus rhombeus]
MDTRKRRYARSTTALAEPEAERRAAAGASSTASDQSFAKTKDSPSAVLELQKVKAQLQIEKTKCSFLEEKVKELQADKAFLQSQLTSQGKGQSSSSAMSSSIKISSDSESAGSFNFSLPSDEEAKPRVKNEKSSHYDNPRMRMKTMTGVINRYKKALKREDIGFGLQPRQGIHLTS